ncbi:hypothetical protein [Limnoglobus roseus]|uniref:Uncharacterized protein n=1 Tax=Limnoglobus roseus TaxID=2598579 RepID=A0A5C1AKA9_9BACT|nr:hypothetical protein [Limnoglobus roseus]QEL18617.1 hypothetical protein PX52LOC_05650 [Limnoglobus roseus]
MADVLADDPPPATSPETADPFCPEHVAELAGSGIPPEFALAAGWQTEFDATINGNTLNWKGPADAIGPCLRIPYFDPDGRPMRFTAPGWNWPSRSVPKGRTLSLWT